MIWECVSQGTDCMRIYSYVHISILCSDLAQSQNGSPRAEFNLLGVQELHGMSPHSSTMDRTL